MIYSGINPTSKIVGLMYLGMGADGVAPGWDSPSGVFSHENPNLRCADGTFNTDAIGRCVGT